MQATIDSIACQHLPAIAPHLETERRRAAAYSQKVPLAENNLPEHIKAVYHSMYACFAAQNGPIPTPYI
ncbi:hypothetical protein [Paenibacillus roseus]|uniref:hypothetical protein n=1 Tax=Paenibacillus roseus TaxID=2798579 RepID=UPI0018EB5E65|nr:hypothetical protein [Paenibacillus roseus]